MTTLYQRMHGTTAAIRRCACARPDRMRETPDNAPECAYCGGRIIETRAPFVGRALDGQLPVKVFGR